MGRYIRVVSGGGSPKNAVRAGRKAWTKSEREAGNKEANRPIACIDRIKHGKGKGGVGVRGWEERVD